MGLFRTEIQGTSPAAGEVWSCGLNWSGPLASLTFEDLRDWATNIGTAIAAMSGNGLISVLSTAGAITKIRTEERDLLTDELIQAAEFTLGSPKSGLGTLSKTLQTSACISLLTGRPGRSYRGRIYWPTWAYTGTASGLFGGSDPVNWLAGFKVIVDAIETAAAAVDPSFNMILIVRSRLLHESNPVTLYGLGSVPDTQRRRRDAIAETYTTLAP